jgi:MFS family permease
MNSVRDRSKTCVTRKNGKESGRSTRRVLGQRTVVLVTGQYGLLAMAYILWDETIPLFLKLDPDRGGFGLDSSRIGLLLSSSGAFMLGFTSLLLPAIMVRYTKKSVFQSGILLALPMAFALPALAILSRSALEWFSPYSPPDADVDAGGRSNEGFAKLLVWTLWILLLVCVVMKNVTSCITFTSNMIMINNSVFDPYLGAVNGLGQSLASLARAVGPALGGALWSVSVQISPFVNFVAIFLGLCSCLSINFYLPDAVNSKKIKKIASLSQPSYTQKEETKRHILGK